MMLEAEIEEIIKRALRARLSLLAYSGVQILGAWDVASDNAIKSIEDDSAQAYLTVKVKPREYDTFTIAEANFPATLTLNVRAGVDADGAFYRDLAGAVLDVLQGWQSSFEDYKTAFRIQNYFAPQGFRLDGGDCGLDREAGVWTIQQSFTINGVIL